MMMTAAQRTPIQLQQLTMIAVVAAVMALYEMFHQYTRYYYYFAVALLSVCNMWWLLKSDRPAAAAAAVVDAGQSSSPTSAAKQLRRQSAADDLTYTVYQSAADNDDAPPQRMIAAVRCGYYRGCVTTCRRRSATRTRRQILSIVRDAVGWQNWDVLFSDCSVHDESSSKSNLDDDLVGGGDDNDAKQYNVYQFYRGMMVMGARIQVQISSTYDSADDIIAATTASSSSSSNADADDCVIVKVTWRVAGAADLDRLFEPTLTAGRPICVPAGGGFRYTGTRICIADHVSPQDGTIRDVMHIVYRLESDDEVRYVDALQGGTFFESVLKSVRRSSSNSSSSNEVVSSPVDAKDDDDEAIDAWLAMAVSVLEQRRHGADVDLFDYVTLDVSRDNTYYDTKTETPPPFRLSDCVVHKSFATVGAHPLFGTGRLLVRQRRQPHADPLWVATERIMKRLGKDGDDVRPGWWVGGVPRDDDGGDCCVLNSTAAMLRAKRWIRCTDDEPQMWLQKLEPEVGCVETATECISSGSNSSENDAAAVG